MRRPLLVAAAASLVQAAMSAGAADAQAPAAPPASVHAAPRIVHPSPKIDPGMKVTPKSGAHFPMPVIQPPVQKGDTVVVPK